MTTQGNFRDEWLDRAFRLAFFLHGDRETAKKIAIGAMNKLETASNAQFKRLYYKPTGRSENAKATRSRVSLSDLQLLQRLVFVESESFELEKEASGQAGERDLLRFFIKHLVRISLKRNSFYVTLAVSRILHSYATADAMEIYNVVVQDPERVHDDYYYRSRKGLMMKELKSRFGGLLEVVKVNRGEERFDSRCDTDGLVETAHDCLRNFMPWSSTCSVPEEFDPFSAVIESFHFDKNDPDEEHRTEVNRIHAALHPDCFDRLARALRLASPREALEIPNFMITEDRKDPDTDSNDPPALNEDELNHMKAVLAGQAASRKAVSAGFLRVVIDGVQAGRFGAGQSATAAFDLGSGSELIEIYSDGGVLLATHLLGFDSLRHGDQRHTIMLGAGQKFVLDLRPRLDEFGEVESIALIVDYPETGLKSRLEHFAAGLKVSVGAFLSVPFLKPALTFGIIAAAIGIGWVALRGPNETGTPVAESDTRMESTITPIPPDANGRGIGDYAVKEPPAKDPVRRAPNRPVLANAPRPAAKRKSVPLQPNDSVDPAPQTARNEHREKEVDENGVLRLPMRDPGPEPRFDRGLSRNANEKRLVGEPFKTINYVFFDLSGDAVLGEQIARELADELNRSGRFVITSDKSLAQGRLKIHVRHESDVDDPDEKTVAVVVRMINAKGYVVYPNRRRISAWKYVGTIKKVPLRVAADLTAPVR